MISTYTPGCFVTCLSGSHLALSAPQGRWKRSSRQEPPEENGETFEGKYQTFRNPMKKLTSDEYLNYNLYQDAYTEIIDG